MQEDVDIRHTPNVRFGLNLVGGLHYFAQFLRFFHILEITIPTDSHMEWSSTPPTSNSFHSSNYPVVRRERFGAGVPIFPKKISYLMGSRLELLGVSQSASYNHEKLIKIVDASSPSDVHIKKIWKCVETYYDQF